MASQRIEYEITIAAVPAEKILVHCTSLEKAKSKARRIWKRKFAKKDDIKILDIEVKDGE